MVSRRARPMSALGQKQTLPWRSLMSALPLHRAIQHTARYTELSQERFKDFWRT
jgi:hypothetical protein